MTQPLRFPWYTLFSVMLLLLPGRVAAQSATLTDDAFLSSNTATQLANANGQGIALVVAGSNATVGPVHVGTTKSFIKFQLQSSLPPSAAAANVAKATLKLFISPSCNPNGAIDIYPVTGVWTESTLSPSAPPALSSTAFATAIAVGKPNTYLVVDVTHLVQQWLEGSANGGLDNDGIALVADTSSTNVIFDSKEDFITSHEPRLEIVLVDSGPQGPAGPQGPQGVTGPAGPGGPAGAAGSAATVNVGTTMTVPAGTPASVLNGGTATNAVLNFLIPQGPTGLTGPQGVAGPVGATGAMGAMGPTGPQGPAGPQGSQGLVGAMGPIGPAGPQGTQGPQGPVGINNRGAWSASNNYNINDGVSDQGSFWLTVQAVAANTPNSEPSTTNPSWQLLAAQGTQGPQGQTGPQGPQGLQGATGAQGTMGLMGPTGPAGPQGSAGPQGPQGPAGISSAGGGNSLLSAFLPGPLTQAYTAASFVPDTPITVTHISAALKTAPDAACAPAVLRVTDGSTGQDVRLLAGQAARDTGPVTLPFNSGTNLQVRVQTPANCSVTNPADANLVVEYRGQLSSDQTSCAQSGLACNGICEETQTDPNNCGACGKVCQQTCVGGVCGGCSAGLIACGGSCTNPLSDPSNCGACGNVCAAPGGGSAVCSSGQCTQTCPQPLASAPVKVCGGQCVSLSLSPNNCGACGKVCPSPGPCLAPICGGEVCGGTPVADGTVCGSGLLCASGQCLLGAGGQCTNNSQCASGVCLGSGTCQ